MHAEDVVNGGFLQGDTDHVVVQVVYDEDALTTDGDAIEALPLTRELEPQEPLALNPMRITVDGVPVDDPERSSADIQRCTDVALDEASIAFRFDDLSSERRLSVSSTSPAVLGDPVRFRMYSNYPHYIARAEVRVFEQGESLRAEPLALVELDPIGLGDWTPDPALARPPYTPLAFVLRAYDEDGRFDETAPQSLWLVRDAAGTTVGAVDVANEGRVAGSEPLGTSNDALIDGYGESERHTRGIPLESASTVRVAGDGIPAEHTVWLAGTQLPVDPDGRFVGEVLLPAGVHSVEVAGARRRGQRRALPARPRPRTQRLVLRRPRRPDGVGRHRRGPEQGPARGQPGARLREELRRTAREAGRQVRPQQPREAGTRGPSSDG